VRLEGSKGESGRELEHDRGLGGGGLGLALGPEQRGLDGQRPCLLKSPRITAAVLRLVDGLAALEVA
jgi:hypothetical protein